MSENIIIEVGKDLAKRGFVEVVNRAKDGTIQQIIKVGEKELLANAGNLIPGSVISSAVSVLGDVISTCVLENSINEVGGKVDVVDGKVDALNGIANLINNKVDNAINGINIANNNILGVDKKVNGMIDTLNFLKQNVIGVGQKIDGVNNGINAINGQIKNVAQNIYGLQQSLKVIGQVQGIGIALEAINLVVTAKGFAVMNKRMNEIIDSISQMQESLRRISKKQELDIVKDFKEVKDDYSEMLDAAKRQTPYSEQQYYALTRKLHSMIEYLYACFMSDAVENKGVILDAIYILLPMYANVMRKYDTEYYFAFKDRIETGSVWHNQHNEWMSTFDSLMDKEYLDKYQDYCFLDESMTGRQADEALLVSYLAAVNSATVVDDNQKILLCFDDVDHYKEFQKELITTAEDSIKKALNEYDEETVKLLNPSIQVASKELAASMNI